VSLHLASIDSRLLTKITAFEVNDTLQLKGLIGDASTNPHPPQALDAARSIQALSNNVDEPVIPVYFDGSLGGMYDLNGFYQVASSQVTIPPGGMDLKDWTGAWPFSISLVPIPDKSLPRVESILDSVFRTESTSLVSSDGDPWHAIPSSVLMYDDGTTGQTLTMLNQWVTASGTISLGSDTTNSLPLRRISNWRCRPQEWYFGAATIERQLSDSTGPWTRVIGRDFAVAVPTQQGWGINNGIVRFRGPAAATPDLFTIEVFDPFTGNWESPLTMRFPIYSSPSFGTRYVQAAGVSILRNDPAEVRIRIAGTTDIFTPPSIIDIRLRRGAPFVDIHWAMANSSAAFGLPNQLLVVTPSLSFTTSTNSVHATSADASGNIVFLTHPSGALTNTTLTTFDVGIGYVPASAVWNVTSARNNYYAPSSELVRLVGS
jgi:hypothetical protein